MAAADVRGRGGRFSSRPSVRFKGRLGYLRPYLKSKEVGAPPQRSGRYTRDREVDNCWILLHEEVVLSKSLDAID